MAGVGLAHNQDPEASSGSSTQVERPKAQGDAGATDGGFTCYATIQPFEMMVSCY